MKILIIGGGIAGLTAALALSRQNHDVVLFEKSEAFGEVGAGLQISPNASRELIRLGLQDALEQVAFNPRSLDMRRGHSGRQVFSIPLDEQALKKYGAPYWHLHRADLVNALVKALKDMPNCEIRSGTHVSDYAQAKESVFLTLENGGIEQGDIVVGADGIHSRLQKLILSHTNARFTGNVAWRTTIATTDEIRKLIPPSATVWTGNKSHAVTYYIRGGELMNFVGVIEQNEWSKETWTEEGDPNELREHFSGYCPAIKSALQHVSQCFKWALHDRQPLPKWTDGRAVLIGDAAHPMLPFLAQGAAMGIEDAAFLTHCLLNHSTAPSAGLKHFERTRLPRTSRVQAGARSNMKLFHIDNSPVSFPFFSGMGIVNAFAPNVLAKRQDWLYCHDVLRTHEAS